MSGDGIVISLEDGGEDRAFSGLDVIDFLDICGFVIGQAELSEGKNQRKALLADRGGA